MTLRIIYLAITFQFLNTCVAQSDSLKSIIGLPTKEVYQVLVDKKGFVWIAHELGVSKYDGINFTTFSHPQQISLSLFDLIEDDNGRIWCHNLSGQIFYIENNQINILKNYINNGVRYYPEKAFLNNEIIINASNGIYVQNTNLKTGHFILKTITGLKIGATYSFCYLNNNQLLIQGEKKYFIYKKGFGVEEIKRSDSTILDAHASGLLIAVNNDTIYNADRYDGILYKYLLKNKFINLVGKQTYSGVINGSSIVGNRFWLHTSEASITTDYKDSVNGYNISSVAIDKEGNYWFSSLKKGLLSKAKNASYKLIQSSYIKLNDFVKCICIQNNYILEGTAEGVLLLKQIDGVQKPKIITLPNTRGGIEKIFKLGDSRFLVATLSNFYIFDAASNIYTSYYYENSVKSIATYNSYTFLANNENLSIKNLKDNNSPKVASWQALSKIFNIPKQLQDTSINFSQSVKSVCFNTNNNTLYINFFNGVYALNKFGIKEVLFQNRAIHASSLLYAEGKIFIGTLVNGLIIINDSNIYNITSKNGLNSNTIIKMRLCSNRLWLLSGGNVQAFNVQQLKLITNIALPPLLGGFIYDVDEINNDIYFTTVEGIYKSNINSYLTSEQPLNYLTSVIANQSDTLPLLSNTLVSDGTKSISFSVVALWYTNPQSVFFKYRLLGSGTNEWHIANTNQRVFSFTGLSSGNYQFQAIAVNGVGVLAKTPIVYSFKINEPLWQQWWLYLIILAIIIDILYFSIQQRINIITKRNELLVDKIQLQAELRNSMLTAIKSQMNPHFIFNALNTIQSFIYSNDKSKANSYLGKFSNLIRIILDNSNKKAIPLNDEIETLKLYLALEEMRFESTLQVTIEVDPTIDVDAFFIPPMLIQPFVENAIKHGLLHKVSNRQLLISFKPTNNNSALEIIIDDNGIGRANSTILNLKVNGDHNSFAMQANQTRIDILNQLSSNKIKLAIIDKKDQLGNALGTKVCLTIPNEFLI